MNLKQDIETCLKANNWSPSRLAQEANIHPSLITRLLNHGVPGKSATRKGLNSSTLTKLFPFLYGDKAKK